MATVAELKTKARELERHGHLDKALAVYRHVLKHLEGQPALEAELPLFVKVGDLEWKQGRPDEAVAMYERGAEHYVARGAGRAVIALCVKILRVDATRTSVFRRFVRALLDAGHVAAAREVLLDYAERAKRTAAVTALQRVADQPEDEVRSALERMLGASERAGSGPRPAIEEPGVTASAPRPAVEPPRGTTGSRPAVAGHAISGQRPAVDVERAAPPAGSAPTSPPPPPAIRFSPSREAEALDQDVGPTSVPMDPATFREPFRPRGRSQEEVDEEHEDRAPPPPRMALSERRRALVGTARRASRARSKRIGRWMTITLMLLAATALVLGYVGLVPLDVRGLLGAVGIGRDAAADGSVGGAGLDAGTAAPIAVGDSATVDATSASPDTIGDSTITSRTPAPRGPSGPSAPPLDTAPTPEVVRRVGPPPPSAVPTPADSAPADATASGTPAGDSAVADAAPSVRAPERVRLPAGFRASGPVVVVSGLPVASVNESPSGHEVVHRLEDGGLLTLSASRFGGGATDEAAPSPVRVTTVAGDTAVGTARVGGFMVSARAHVSPDALQALLRRLVIIEAGEQQ